MSIKNPTLAAGLIGVAAGLCVGYIIADIRLRNIYERRSDEAIGVIRDMYNERYNRKVDALKETENSSQEAEPIEDEVIDVVEEDIQDEVVDDEAPEEYRDPRIEEFTPEQEAEIDRLLDDLDEDETFVRRMIEIAREQRQGKKPEPESEPEDEGGDEVVDNVYTQGRKGDLSSQLTELGKVDEDQPEAYFINEDVFLLNEKHYYQMTMSYFVWDEFILDETEKIVDPEGTALEDIVKRIPIKDGLDIVYIRINKINLEVELILEKSSYESFLEDQFQDENDAEY